MTGTEARQVRRARERQEAEPKRFYATHPNGNRATRAASRRKSRDLRRAHPTKTHARLSFHRIIAQHLMRWIFAAAAARAGIMPGDVGAVV